MKDRGGAMRETSATGNRRYRHAGMWFFLVLLVLMATGQVVHAGVPVVSNLTVSDVTTRSFTVSWLSSEPATGELYLFQGDCVTPIASPFLESSSSDRTGYIRVTVADLSAATSYCVQIATKSKSTAEVAVSPGAPLPVTTEKLVKRTAPGVGKTIPVGNDLLKVPAPYLMSTADSQDGVLVMMNLADVAGSKPLSVLLTADDTRNYFNMNNLFDAAGESLNLVGGERVRITERHGAVGCGSLERFRKVPADSEITRARDFTACVRVQDVDCSDSVTILDILRVAHGTGAVQGALCFNSDLDVNGDGTVDLLDVDAVIGGFDATP